MNSEQTLRAIQAEGWEVRWEISDNPMCQAFFRGFQTQWRATLAEVLADVEALSEPTKQPK